MSVVDAQEARAYRTLLGSAKDPFHPKPNGARSKRSNRPTLTFPAETRPFSKGRRSVALKRVLLIPPFLSTSGKMKLCEVPLESRGRFNRFRLNL